MQKLIDNLITLAFLTVYPALFYWIMTSDLNGVIQLVLSIAVFISAIVFESKMRSITKNK